MPRLLFPNKPIYQATIKTNKFTGKSYAGMEEGASFSLGYFADSYVTSDIRHVLAPGPGGIVRGLYLQEII